MSLRGNAWKMKKVFGYIRYGKGSSFSYFESWQPRVWNSGCITVSRIEGYINLSINGEFISTYHGRPPFDTNIVLMNKMDGGQPNHGAITDVNIWSRRLSPRELKDWAFCEGCLFSSIKGFIIFKTFCHEKYDIFYDYF